MKTKLLFCIFLLFSLIFLAACSLPFSGLIVNTVPSAEPLAVPTSQQTPEPTPSPTPTPTPQPYPNGFDICGRHYEITASELDLSGITDTRDINIFREIIPFAENLQTIQLGSESGTPVSWEVISQLQEIAPDLHYVYSFSLYGEPMTLDTEYIDLRKISVSDDGASVISALPCMKKCKTLDMDSCGVDNEHMAAIRDAFPHVKVIWRVRFSTLDYSVRTDVKTILASLTGEGPYAGITTEESALPLTYCTEVINLDLGHNNNMRTLSFLRYMPNLEVFITYNNFLRDVDDLSYCKKLRYLELYGSSMYNINSIAELDELTDLQLSFCYNLEDISPIVPADKVPKLRRLFLTPDCIPEEQIEAFKATLEELAFADVLLHVIDLSSPEWEEQAWVVDDLIRQLGAEQTPCIRVFNKCDAYMGILPHGENIICVSAKTREGLPALTALISKLVDRGRHHVHLMVPYSDAGLTDMLNREAIIERQEYTENGIEIDAIVPSEIFGKVRPFIPGWQEPHEAWEL